MTLHSTDRREKIRAKTVDEEQFAPKQKAGTIRAKTKGGKIRAKMRDLLGEKSKCHWLRQLLTADYR